MQLYHIRKNLNLAQMIWGASFYGVSSILLIYYRDFLQLEEADVIVLLSLSTAISTLLTALGGILADRVLGFSRSAIFGFLLYSFAYIIYAISAVSGSITGSILALSVMALGRGISNTSIPSMLSYSYKIPQEDMPAYAQKNTMERVFLQNYMSTNIGSFVFRILSPWIAKQFHFVISFLIALILISIDLFLFRRIRKALLSYPVQEATRKQHQVDTKPFFSFRHSHKRNLLLFVGLILFLLFLIQKSFLFKEVTTLILYIMSGFVFFYYLYATVKHSHPQERIAMFGSFIVLFEILCFAIYFQEMYSSMSLYALNMMQPKLGSLHFEPASVQAFNPFWVIVMSPLLSMLFTKLEKSGKRIIIPSRFVIGMILSSTAFGVLALSSLFVLENGKISIGWFIFAHLLQSTSELMTNAMGIALLGKIIPTQFTGFSFGLRLTIMSLAALISGKIATFIALPKGQVANPLVYGHFFGVLSLIAIFIAFMMAILSPVIKRIMHKAAISL